MRKPLLSFRNFINEDETDSATGSSTTTTTTGTDPARPETEREAKSRIAASLVKSLFGDVSGVTGSIDGEIRMTPEVKDSLPYKGCGTSEPFKFEKTPISVDTFKIILNYLNEKKVGNYSRAIKELDEKRALIVGLRNKLDIKKESINQDRFIDALYFIPGGTKSGSDLLAANTTGPKGPLAPKGSNESRIVSFSDFSKLYEDDDDVFSRLKRGVGSPATGAATGASTGAAIGATGTAAGSITLGDKFLPYQITTVPSLAFYGKDPLNPKGTGIKLPGDTLYFLKEHTLGHGKYKMMVEGEKINVARYPIGVTKFETYKPSDVYNESCGMEIHRSSTKGVGVCVGPWSAGCQVFADYEEFKEFISKAEKESMNAGKFIYALIQLDDVPADVMNNAMNGISPIDVEAKAEDAANLQADDAVQNQDGAEEVDDNTEEIKGLAKFIKTEKEKTNSDEESVISRYNQVIRSDADWKKLKNVYGSNLWDDLDSFLSSSELEDLKFRDKEST
jgi:hypothetical protein